MLAVLAILAVLVVVIGGAWIINSQLQPKGKQWVSLGSWSGSPQNNDITTEQFVITGDEWRINWRCNDIGAFDLNFLIIVMNATAHNVTKEIQTPFQTYSGEDLLDVKGRFYLHIVILGSLGDWNVQVSEYE